MKNKTIYYNKTLNLLGEVKARFSCFTGNPIYVFVSIDRKEGILQKATQIYRRPPNNLVYIGEL
jgi:hypothetical protein